MDFAQFSDFAQARGCRQVQDDAFGIYRGYPFAVHYKKGGKGQLTATFKFGAKAPKSLLKEMRAALKPYGAAPMSYAPDRMGFLLSGKDGVDENFDGALSALAELFAAAGVTPPAACPFCKGQGCDTLAFVGGGYVPVHRTCLDRVLGGSAAAARRSLTHHRKSNALRLALRFREVCDRAVRAGCDRYAGLDGRALGLRLVAHTADGRRGRPNESQPVLDDLFRKFGVLRKKAKPRVDGLCTAGHGRRDNIVHIQIAVARWRRADTDGLVRNLRMQRIAVGF